MRDNRPVVYVIIVTYNGIKWINRCLSSVILKRDITIKVIIVDNGSNDGTVEFIKSKYTEVVLLEMNKNLGFGAANNVGMKMALENNTDYVFLLNQDAWIEKDTIEKLISVHKNNSDYKILAPIRKTNDSAIESNVLLNIVQKNCQQLLSDNLLGNPVKEIYKIDYTGAAAWLVSVECLLKVGGFDPLFFHYGEDNDYAERVQIQNFKIGICPLIFVTHDVEQRVPSRLRKHRMRKASCLFNIKFKKQNRIREAMGVIYCLFLDLLFEKTHFLRRVFKIYRNRGLAFKEYPAFLRDEIK